MAIYSYDEAFQECLTYFSGDELAGSIFIDKYALRNENNELVETNPTDMFWRIAREIARIEKKKFKTPLSEQQIFDLIDRFKYIVPQGSNLYGIGNHYKYVYLGNCVVVSQPSDSYYGILKTDQEIIATCKRRSGAGTSISNLRPVGSTTKNAAGSSSGIISFLKRYSNSLREVAQNNRRGAGCITLSVHHPQILDFIKSKTDKKEITGVNISVQFTNEFMSALLSDSDYEQRFPVDSKSPIISKMVSAKYIWKEFIKSARDTAEPGAQFIDTVWNEGLSDCYDEFKSVTPNPCGEQYMQQYGSCALLLINLLSFVENPFTDSAWFNFEKFYNYCKFAQRIQDDILDLNIECLDRIINKVLSDPEPLGDKQIELNLWKKIKEQVELSRRTGTGITALADTFAALDFEYGDDDSLEFSENLFQILNFACIEASVDLAEELGPFPLYNAKLEENCPTIQRLTQVNIELDNHKLSGSELVERMERVGRRNAALTTISPAGTISNETQTTSGIEPVFALTYKRRKKLTGENFVGKVDFIDKTGDKWQEYEVVHSPVKAWQQATGKTDLKESPWFGSTAHDVQWQNKLKLLAVIQPWIHNAISQTTNLPANTSYDEVDQIYLEAYKAKLKGITVYVDGSRDGVLLKEKKPNKRPRELKCDVYHVSVKGQKYFVLVGLTEVGMPYEVFAGKNGFLDSNIKTGRIIRKRKGFYKAIFDDKDETELAPCTINSTDGESAIMRLVSLSLQSNVDLNKIVMQLEKVPGDLTSFSKSIARALKRYIPDGTDVGETCPECGEPLVRKAGCSACPKCSYSKC